MSLKVYAVPRIQDWIEGGSTICLLLGIHSLSADSFQNLGRASDWGKCSDHIHFHQLCTDTLRNWVWFDQKLTVDWSRIWHSELVSWIWFDCKMHKIPICCAHGAAGLIAPFPQDSDLRSKYDFWFAYCGIPALQYQNLTYRLVLDRLILYLYFETSKTWAIFILFCIL